jgi:hypothetical protein
MNPYLTIPCGGYGISGHAMLFQIMPISGIGKKENEKHPMTVHARHASLEGILPWFVYFVQYGAGKLECVRILWLGLWL